MKPDLLTRRMIANAVQSALDCGALFHYMRDERIWKSLQQQWDPAWNVRAPWRVISQRHIGYTLKFGKLPEGAI